jgi:hypothetical protein
MGRQKAIIACAKFPLFKSTCFPVSISVPIHKTESASCENHVDALTFVKLLIKLKL